MTSVGEGPSLWDRFETEPGHADAIVCVQQWLDALPPGLGPDELHLAIVGQGVASSTLSAILRSAGYFRWADIASMISSDDSLDGFLGKALMFRAGVQVARTSERDDFLDVAKAALSPLLYSDYGAAAELAKYFVSDRKARDRLEAALFRLITEGKADPNRLAHRPRPQELQPALPTTQNLWSSGYATAMVRHGWAYSVLRVDPAAYTRLLHGLPIGLAHTTVMLGREFALDELATLVGTAPSAFSDDGVPVASGALYALLERAHQTLSELEQATITESVGPLVDAALSRVDAPLLGRTWCQRVLWEAPHHHSTRSQVWPGVLFDALTARLDPLPEAESQAWIKAERLDQWQVDRVLVEAAILLYHERRADVPCLLEWALDEGLVSASGRERALTAGSLEANLLVQSFTGQDLVAWFDRVWTKGYVGRERHRIGTYRKLDDTARSTLCWGLAALNSRDLHRRAEGWDSMFDALREMYLLDESYNWIGDLGPTMFRFAAALCTAMVARGELAPSHLVALLDLVTEPTVRFGSFVSMMVQQDEAVTLAAAMAIPCSRVLWALEHGVLAVPASQSQLTSEALAGIASFAAKMR